MNEGEGEGGKEKRMNKGDRKDGTASVIVFGFLERGVSCFNLLVYLLKSFAS